MNNQINIKGMWDLPLAWIGSVTTLTYISTVVGIVAGLTTIAFTVYRAYILHKKNKTN